MSIANERKKITDQITQLQRDLDEIENGIYDVSIGGNLTFRKDHPPRLIRSHMAPITRITFSQESIEFWDGKTMFSLAIEPTDAVTTPLTIEVVGYD